MADTWLVVEHGGTWVEVGSHGLDPVEGLGESAVYLLVHFADAFRCWVANEKLAAQAAASVTQSSCPMDFDLMSV